MVDNAEGDGPEKGGGEPNGDGDGEQDESTVKQVSYYVRMRPGLFEFLTKAAAMFEVRMRINGDGGGGYTGWVPPRCGSLNSAVPSLNSRSLLSLSLTWIFIYIFFPTSSSFIV